MVYSYENYLIMLCLSQFYHDFKPSVKYTASKKKKKKKKNEWCGGWLGWLRCQINVLFHPQCHETEECFSRTVLRILACPVLLFHRWKSPEKRRLCPIGHLADEQTCRVTINQPQPCADLRDSPAGPLQKALIILRWEGFQSSMSGLRVLSRWCRQGVCFCL